MYACYGKLFQGMYMFKQVSFVVNNTMIHHTYSFIYSRRKKASESHWGKTQFEIKSSCRTKHKLLPSSTYCSEQGYRIWTNVFRVEEDLEIETGIC
jgi:hypothetical protein